MLICDKCQAAISPGSQFCPQCGDSVTAADEARNNIALRNSSSATVSFGYSTSAGYEKAVSICQKIPSYVATGDGKLIQHSITLPLTEVDLISNIYDLVGSWKSSRMTIGGSQATKKDLTYGCLACYRNRQRAYKPETYCYGESQYEANIWGCKRLSMPINEWGGGWLEFGTFDTQGVWHFDKNRIKHDLESGVNQNSLCPAFNSAQVFETLAQLPTVINPKIDKNWRYRTSYEDINGDYKEVATGIRPVLTKASHYVIGSFKPNWNVEEPEPAHAHSKDAMAASFSPSVSPNKGRYIAIAVVILLIVLWLLK